MEDKSIIKIGNITFPSSVYQQNIFNEIEHGYGNMVITAAAGSAKTTTIENCLRFIPKGKKSLLIAFNVSTAAKLKEDIGENNNTLIVTFHGLGNRILRENKILLNDIQIDEFKYSKYIKTHLEELTNSSIIHNPGPELISYIYNITFLSTHSRYYLAMREREIEKVAKLYGIEPICDEIEVTRKVLLWGKQHFDTIDHTDMIWLPNVLNLNTRRYLFDFIFIDEAQDTTLAHQAMIDKCFGRSCRFVAIGDPMQQINVWCGATEESIENYKKRENTHLMPLPISYRCPKSIVELAKKYSPDIEAAETAIDGTIRYDVSQYDPRPGDMVICRIMSKLLELYLSYLRINKKAFLVGYNAVKQTYIDLIDKTKSLYVDLKKEKQDGLINSIELMYSERMAQIMETIGLSEEEAIYHPELFNLYDSIESLKVLGEGVETTDELKEKINTIFEGDDKDAVILTTVHKAKGLEADNIFILCPSLMPSALATKEWEIQAEKNLIYVAITRAKKSLNYIKEEKKGFFKNFYTNAQFTKNKRPQIISDQTTVESINKKESKNSKKAGLKFKNLM